MNQGNLIAIANVISISRKVITTILVTSIGILVIPACKKNPDKKPVCRIVSVANEANTVQYTITYGSDGRINKIAGLGQEGIYVYAGNKIIITTMTAGVIESIKTITVNENGLASNARTENEDGTDWINDAYEYNGEEVQRSTRTSSAGTQPSVTIYTWFEHNLVSINAGTTEITYYLDKLRQVGDYFFIAQTLSQGYEVFRTKNLLKSLPGLNIAYDFSPEGRINAMISANGTTTSTLKYQYQCE